MYNASVACALTEQKAGADDYVQHDNKFWMCLAAKLVYSTL